MLTAMVITFTGPSRPFPVIDQSILSFFLALDIEGLNEENDAFPAISMVCPDISWYCPWLSEHIANLPGSLRSFLNSERNSESLIHLTLQSKIYRESIRQGNSPSIDQVIEHLVEKI